MRTIPSNQKGIELATAAIPDTLAALKVDPEAGLAREEARTRLKEHGHNEVIERRGHPVLKFPGKFWGVSAWIPEAVELGG